MTGFPPDGSPPSAQAAISISSKEHGSALNKRQIVVFLCLLFVMIILVAGVFEEWLEQPVYAFFHLPYDEGAETANRWASTRKIVAFCGISLILPIVVLFRMLKAHETAAEAGREARTIAAISHAKSLFIANMSHELRTPLNAIIGFSEILASEIFGSLNEKQKGYANDILYSGKHLLGIVNDILDITRAEMNSLVIDVADVDIRDVPRQAEHVMAVMAENAGVALRFEIADVAAPLIGRADEKRLRQALINLISNSIKFTPTGGSVTVAAAAKEAWASIEIADNGTGIAPEDISKALTPFVQVDSSLTRKHEGTGLGLPLAKRFIEAMGGSLTLQSAIGKGTKATIFLPRVVGNA